MRPTRPAVTALVATAALAIGLGLGSAGTASAAALTKSSVKKIAAKVVAQKSAGLSVAHATTADTAHNADNATTASTASTASTAGTLQGYTGASLATIPAVFTIAPGGSFGQLGEWLLPPLSPGTYDFRFNASLVPDAFGTTVACGFRNPSAPANVFGLAQATYNSPFLAAWPVGSTVHTVTAGEQVSFLCTISGSTFTIGGTGATIEVTLLNGSTTTPLTPLSRPTRSTPGLARH